MPSDSLVCFRDIDPVLRETCCRLKIITTNLESGSLELFDDKTPDVVVADAVAASFAIPLFFKPAKVRCIGDDASETTLAGPYVDGGLVSNLPIWVFSEDKKAIERAVDNRTLRPLPIVAFQLVGAADAARGERRNSFMALFDYVERVLRTGIFGGQSITETFVTHLTTIPLPAALGTLGFDCTGEQALADYTRGRETARRRLEATFRDNPTRRYELLARVINAAEKRSAAIRTDGRKVALRACLVRRLGGNRSFKVSASINMHDDADDDLVLDQKNPGAPVAFRDRDVTYVDARAPETNLAMTKYELALVPDRLAAIISVPIYSSIGAWSAAPALRAEPIGVLCLDGDLPLDQEYRDRDFIRMLAELAVEAAPYMVFEKETS